MGTRGMWGWAVDGEEKFAYNHFDSYPDGLGATILSFLRENDIGSLKDRARTIKMVNEDAQPTAQERQVLSRWRNEDVNSGQGWYSLLRETQGEPELTLQAGYMIDGRDFALDSLFCEWAYVIDLDHERLEVYRGFQTEPHDQGRFAKRPPYVPDHRTDKIPQYYPVKLVGVWALRELPSYEEFASTVDPPEDEE